MAEEFHAVIYPDPIWGNGYFKLVQFSDVSPPSTSAPVGVIRRFFSRRGGVSIFRQSGSVITLALLDKY